MCMGKKASFPVFALFQPGFGTFVCKIRVCMPGVDIIEIRGISGVFGCSGILLSFVMNIWQSVRRPG